MWLNNAKSFFREILLSNLFVTAVWRMSTKKLEKIWTPLDQNIPLGERLVQIWHGTQIDLLGSLWYQCTLMRTQETGPRKYSALRHRRNGRSNRYVKRSALVTKKLGSRKNVTSGSSFLIFCPGWLGVYAWFHTVKLRCFPRVLNSTRVNVCVYV